MKASIRSIPLVAAFVLAGCAAPSPGPVQGSHLLGTWRLVSLQAIPQGEAPVDLWGRQPPGHLVITPQRLMAVLTAQDRKVPTPPFSPQDLAASFVSQSAFTGPWKVVDNRLVVKVDASSYATWVGTEQVREFKLDGRRLLWSTDPMSLPPPANGKTGRMLSVWERID